MRAYTGARAGELEFVCCDLIREDGTTELSFTHASDYTIVVDTIPLDGSADAEENTGETESETAVADGTNEDAAGTVSTDSTAAAQSKGALNLLRFILIGVAVIAAGAFVFVSAKKRKREE